MMTERTRLQAAVDATALSLVNTDDSVPVAELQLRANQYFAASYGIGGFGKNASVSVSKSNSIINVAGATDVDMVIMQFAAYGAARVSAATGVTAGRKKIELALVLDNTGSMASAGKMTALKAALNDLIDELKKK